MENHDRSNKSDPAGCNLPAVVVAFCIAIGLGAPVSSHAGITSIYRYKLIKSADNKVCKHMLNVYNTHFKKPWDMPFSPTNEIYGENSPYAFPKLPGVQHDPKLTYQMRFFRQPSSPEFEAIKWMEGRQEFSVADNIPYSPMLWADFDIDNDGELDTVWVTNFYKAWQTSRQKTHNGAEYLFVFPQGAVSITPFLSNQEIIEFIHGKKPGVPMPRLLSNMADSRHLGIGLRPFIFEGVTYLNSYDQQWRYYPERLAGPKAETIEILKYKSGGVRHSGSYERSKVVTEQICKFRMIPTDKHP